MKPSLHIDIALKIKIIRWAGLVLGGLGIALIVVPLGLNLAYYSRLSSIDGSFTLSSCTAIGSSQTDYLCTGSFRATNASSNDIQASTHKLHVVQLDASRPVAGATLGATYYKNGTLVQIGQSPVSFGKLYEFGALFIIVGALCSAYYLRTGRSRLNMVQGGDGTIISQ